MLTQKIFHPIVSHFVDREGFFQVGKKYEDQETRKITYKFDEKEGVLKMSKIELKKENGS